MNAVHWYGSTIDVHIKCLPLQLVKANCYMMRHIGDHSIKGLHQRRSDVYKKFVLKLHVTGNNPVKCISVANSGKKYQRKIVTWVEMTFNNSLSRKGCSRLRSEPSLRKIIVCFCFCWKNLSHLNKYRTQLFFFSVYLVSCCLVFVVRLFGEPRTQAAIYYPTFPTLNEFIAGDGCFAPDMLRSFLVPHCSRVLFGVNPRS